MPNVISRRRFLGTAAASGAALGVAKRIWAAEGPPGEKLVVGVMGMGGRGTSLAEEFQRQPGVEVAYVCCADRNRMAAAVKAVAKISTRDPTAVGDFRRILDDRDVDALVCAAPDHWHAPATILACRAGKHVYVEKPCCHNAREGELLVEAARKYRRVVQMGTQRRSYPGLIEAVQKLREGVVGRLLFARTWYNNQRPSIGHGQEVPVPEWLDWDLWQGPAPRRPYRSNVVHYNWHWFWHWGTGELGNNGVHGLDLARWGMGVDYPRQVTSGGGKYCHDDDQETPDSQVLTFDFGEKMITWDCLSWHPRGPEGSMFGATFYGDQGSLVMGDNDYQIYDLKNKLVAQDSGRGNDAQHVADFLDAIRQGKTPNAEIETGQKSTLLCHLGSIAQRTGHTLRCDPQSGRILDDPEAEALWSREYAPGWEPQA